MSYNTRVLLLDNMEVARTALARLGADEAGVEIMTPKAVHRAVMVEEVSLRAALILKQEMLSLGGEAAVNRGVIGLTAESSAVMLLGTVLQFQRLSEKLQRQCFGLPALAGEILGVLASLEKPYSRVLDCRGRLLTLGERTLIMGILNVTPDSFSDGGLYMVTEKAVAKAKALEADGADMIDVGAVSTRPGHPPVSEEEEWRRLQPVLPSIMGSVKVPVSVDTWRAKTAEAALDAGVNLINDQWALQGDHALAGVVARYGVPIVLMHNQDHHEYRDMMGGIMAFLRRGISLAEDAGLAGDRIIVDPGIGFGKDTEQNLELVHRLGELRSLGKPILIGPSRKSLIGNTLELAVHQRVEGTAAIVALGISRGVDIVRVHDVPQMKRVVRMADAVVRRQ